MARREGGRREPEHLQTATRSPHLERPGFVGVPEWAVRSTVAGPLGRDSGQCSPAWIPVDSGLEAAPYWSRWGDLNSRPPAPKSWTSAPRSAEGNYGVGLKR